MTNDPIEAQYQQWAYPQPIPDLDAYVAAGGVEFSDPSRILRKLWPANPPAQPRILIAGCGANQAALIAHRNRQCEVVGIDVAGSAISHHTKLKARHRLDNLTLHRMPIEQVGDLGESFDLVISTGVLHHLADPDLGLAALGRVLKPRGVMSLMVYAQHARQGIYMIQEALRALRFDHSRGAVDLARRIVDQLPTWHPARGYLMRAPDLAYDAGFVDTVLNARDRAYTVPQVMDLVANAGLQFQSWLDGLLYSPTANFALDDPVHDRFEALSQVEQWNTVDLLTCRVGAHRFLVTAGNRTPDWRHDFSREDSSAPWLQYVPARRPDLIIEGDAQLLKLRREGMEFNVAGDVARAVIAADGLRSFRELLDTADNYESAAIVLEMLVEWDLITCAMP